MTSSHHGYVTVNVFLSLVHTARQVMGVGSTRSQVANRKEAPADGESDDWH